MLRLLVSVVLGLLLSSLSLADTLESVMMPGKVIQGHLKWEDNCQKCHKRFDKEGQDQLCKDCHKDINKDVAQKNGYHGKMKQGRNCSECHTEHKGREANIVNLDEKAFKHNLTDFELKGGHMSEKVGCKDCHKPKIKYRDAPAACVGCHKKDDKHKNSLGEKCADCHIEKNWKDIRFDHDKSDFPLKGAHALESKVACKDCHKDNMFKQTPKDCYSCHKKDDEHKGVFGQKCVDCHTEKDWKDSTFDHKVDGHFALLGKHDGAKCQSCHKSAGQKLPKTCIGCHRNDDKHHGSLGENCADCHHERSWSTSTFNHDKDTRFALKDKHKSAKCEACHTSGGLKFEKVAMDCYSCHKKDDVHKGKFGEKCGDCHNARDWKKETFDHDRTKFALKGKHKPAKCESCHVNGLAEKLKTGCNDCHQKDDPHKGAFTEKCERCHNEDDWKKTRFDHDKDTRYPLKGKHRPAKCESCHKPAPAPQKLQTTCYACHQKDDIHKGSEGEKCEKCHTENTWKVKDFDHNKTKFPLLGKHAPVECKKCHLSGDFKDVKKDCYSCHQKDDEHKKRLGTLCEDCHNARDWKVWDYNHDTRTKFKLTGGHKGVACLDCHRTAFIGKVKQNTACYSCHSADDVHGGSFGPQCDRCHVDANFREIKANAGVGR
ncbi:MAG TPA: cytochrome C [Methylophilus sp.]|nr:cytochrome C [Methylophilus sp.]